MFLKKTLLAAGLLGLFLALGMVAMANAEEEEEELEIGKWYPFAETGLNLTQSSYSSNWSGEENGSIVWAAIFNGTLDNQVSQKVLWKNILKLAYGQTHQQVTAADGDRRWPGPEKSTDLIDFETIFRFTLGGYLDPYLSGRFESLFEDVTDPFGRTLSLNPLKFKESAGIARQFIDEEDRSLLSRLGFTLRQSNRKFFADQDTTGGLLDETETLTSNDGGIELINDFKTQLLDDRVTWTSKLSFYKPLFYSGTDEFDDIVAAGYFTNEDLALEREGLDPDVGDFTTALDIDWENIFSSQITKVISVNLYLRWVYDKYDNTVLPQLDETGTKLTNASAVNGAVRKKGQLKQTLSIGIVYRFI